LQPTVRNRALPIEPFRKLIEANRRDQLVRRYETYDELLGYCALSAASVGEIVLRIFELATPERIALSDKVCNALQLVEHWQDVGEDYAADRIYLPAEDRRRFGVADAELAAPHAGPRLRALIDFEVARTRGLLAEGAPLVRTLRGRWAVAVAAFVAGGRAALGAIERADHDVLGTPVQAGPVRRAVELGRLLSASVSRR
jgi:squalene synthase HpnC